VSLAELYREYHGSKSNRIEKQIGLNPHIPGLPQPTLTAERFFTNIESKYADKIADKFSIREPISQVELRDTEDDLPSSKLYSVPFPKSNIPNLFTPLYFKQVAHDPYEELPIYKPPKGIVLPPIRKKKKNKYYRRRR
jgi:hypothetical protein